MTIKDLSEYSAISKQVFQLTQKIKELEDNPISTPTITGMPSSNQISNPTESMATKIIKLKDILNNKLLKLLDEEIAVERFISTISDKEIQTMIRMRFLNLCDWKDIGKEFHCDRTTVYYKIKRYLEKHAIKGGM